MTSRERFAHLKVGDAVRFKSGPRRVAAVWHNGVQFVQIRDGRIGGSHFRRIRHADGELLTTYTWSDIATALRRTRIE